MLNGNNVPYKKLIYHFGVANQKGEATDAVKYFASSENRDLGIIKRNNPIN